MEETEVRSGGSRSLDITYYMHSGFSCAMGGVLLLFDYWLGEYGELPLRARVTPAFLRQFREVYVFISHSHPDHYDPEVYSWQDVPITYVIADELPPHARGIRVKPGQSLPLGAHVKLQVFDSTDLGVSFLVDFDGIRLFHAGDLNFWHWREESSLKEIDEAEAAFRAACAPIEREPTIDVAFFPVDPRQGRLFDAGANYFIMSCKPRLLIPMHFWERAEVAEEFARRCRTRDTEIAPMTRAGEVLHIEMDESGAMDALLKDPEPEAPEVVDPSILDEP